MITNFLNNKLNNKFNKVFNYEEFDYIKKFKSQKLEERLQTSRKIKLKYPNRIPIIIDCKKNIEIDKNKYIVPTDLTIGQFLFTLRRRIQIDSKEAIFLLCNNKMMNVGDVLSGIYELNKDEDDFLYIIISKENVFGN